MIAATITLTACTGDGFLSSPESPDSTGGPLDEYWNDQGALVAHGVSGVREGGAATLGFRPFANSSGDDLVITKIEVEEAYGLEVTDIVAASPKRRQEGGEVDGIGASRGFPPAMLRDEWEVRRAPRRCDHRRTWPRGERDSRPVGSDDRRPTHQVRGRKEHHCSLPVAID